MRAAMRIATGALMMVAAASAVSATADAQIGRLPRLEPPPPAKPPATGIAKAVQTRAVKRDQARFDPTFQKYTKRFFGPGFDWQYFKAQAMAESGLDPDAESWVGARGLMQLMPSTYKQIQTARPEFGAINDPEWNIAAGIMHDRYLWRYWGGKGVGDAQRNYFMFGSYNAGEGTIGRAVQTAKARELDTFLWPNIELVAPNVPRWRYRETLGYVHKIDNFYDLFRKPR
jgi:soluble lytic murein transglycosylase-like protein